MLDDDIESHLEIKAALSGGIAWLITSTQGWVACLGQRKQRIEMDGMSGPNVECFAYGRRRWDRTGLRERARSGCNESMETDQEKRKLCLREQKSGQ